MFSFAFRFTDLPNTHIHVITNSHGSVGSTNSSLLQKQIVQFGIIVDIWVIDECQKAGKNMITWIIIFLSFDVAII